MGDSITASTVIKARADVVSSDLADGAALLDLRSSMYFSVNAVGAHIWAALQEPTTVAHLCDSVAKGFDVTRDMCEGDVLAMIEELKQHDLIEIGHAGG